MPSLQIESNESQMQSSFVTVIIFKKCKQYLLKKHKSESKKKNIKNYCILLAK